MAFTLWLLTDSFLIVFFPLVSIVRYFPYVLISDIPRFHVEIVEECPDTGYAVAEINHRTIEGVVEDRYSAFPVVEIGHVDLRLGFFVFFRLAAG